MLKSFKPLLFFALLLSSPFLSAQVQEVLTSDALYLSQQQVSANKQTEPRERWQAHRPNVLPFWEDFSNNSLFPDTALWLTDTAFTTQQRPPTITLSKGIAAPSKGVATFDGANFRGYMYDDNDLASGINDSLTSHSFDFSGLGVGDSLYLSFFLEPQGRGEGPEFTDTFYVSFDTLSSLDTSGGFWETVWKIDGDSLPSGSFTRVMIPLDQERFFTDQFRLRFHSVGSLNGALDQWHLDYIYLNSNRSAGDTLFNDVSVVNIPASPFAPFTAVPYSQYQISNDYMSPFTIEASTVNSSASGTLRASVVDSSGKNLFSGTTMVSNNTLSLGVYGNDFLLVGPFSDQVVSDTAFAYLEVDAWVDPAGSDINSRNDSITKVFPLAKEFAYDDGVADIGYGITANRAFCQEYPLKAPDSLVAVWVSFTPTLFFNPVTNQAESMDNKSFTLFVWDELVPDSFIVQQVAGAKVSYGNLPNTFIRYPISNPVTVDTVVWVGIGQIDNRPLGVGFDKNANNNSKIYFETSAGQFAQTSQTGTLMIRPEFANPNSVVGRTKQKTFTDIEMQLYPNPIRGEGFQLAFRDRLLKQAQVRIMDLQGRILSTYTEDYPGSDMTVNASRLSNGMYLLRLQGEDIEGRAIRSTKRFIINR